MNIDDCFQILELNSDATIDEIKAARNELLQIWHPDKFPSNSKLSQRAKEKTLKINEAFIILVEYHKTRQQSHKSHDNQTGRKNVSKTQTSTEDAIYREELKRIVKKQEARLEYNERRKVLVKRAKRQLNIGFLSAFFVGVSGLVFGLKELTLFPVLLVLIIGILVSYLTYRKPVKKR
jgi:DnaJ-class molecular chaperone